MNTISLGGAPYISPDGRRISGGYERAGYVEVATGERVTTPAPPDAPFATYGRGWFTVDVMALERPVGERGKELAELWQFDLRTGAMSITDYPADLSTGYGFQPVYGGQVLSYEGRKKQLALNGVPVAFAGHTIEGPQWDGAHYLYQNSQEVIAGRWWKTYVRRCSDHAAILEIMDELRFGRPFAIDGECFVMGNVGAGVNVWAPSGEMKRIEGEGVGAVSDGPDAVMVWTTISTPDNSPLGLFGRRWSDFRKDGKGIWLPGMFHQRVEVAETPTGWLVASFREDAQTMGYDVVPYDTVRVSLPSTPVDPPVDPPTPPDPPITRPILDISHPEGQSYPAPLTVQATTNLPPSQIHWQKRKDDGAWLDVVVTDPPEYFYRFETAGLFSLRAVKGEAVTNERQVSVMEPPPVEPPTPDPPKVPTWLKLLLAILGRKS